MVDSFESLFSGLGSGLGSFFTGVDPAASLTSEPLGPGTPGLAGFAATEGPGPQPLGAGFGSSPFMRGLGANSNSLIGLGLGLMGGTGRDRFGQAQAGFASGSALDEKTAAQQAALRTNDNIKEYMLARQQGYGGTFADWLQEAQARQNKAALNPTYYTETDPLTGKQTLRIGQLNNAGGITPVQMPANTQLAPPVVSVDTGTGTALVSRYGGGPAGLPPGAAPAAPAPAPVAPFSPATGPQGPAIQSAPMPPVPAAAPAVAPGAPPPPPPITQAAPPPAAPPVAQAAPAPAPGLQPQLPAGAPAMPPMPPPAATVPTAAPGQNVIPKNLTGKAEQTKIGTDLGEQFGQINKDAIAAMGMKTTLGRLSQLDPLAFEGRAAPIQQELRSLLVSFGIPSKTVKAGEEFEALTNRLVLDAAGGSLGVGVSTADAVRFEKMVPFLAQSSAGRKEIIDTLGRLADRKIETLKLADAWQKQTGSMKGFTEYMTQYGAQNPIFGESRQIGGKTYLQKGGQWYEF